MEYVVTQGFISREETERQQLLAQLLKGTADAPA